MNFSHFLQRLLRPALAASCVVATLLTACGGGGGGAPVPVPEATVLSVTTVGVLEGQSGLQNMVLTVTLDKPLVAAATISYFTTPTGKGIAGAAGFATGGTSCTAGVDYIQAAQASPVRITIPADGVSSVVTVPIAIICGDTVFEPNETFSVTWSAAGKTGTVVVTIINDDVGGLNSPGVATVLGGVAAFGRDTNTLTNSAADGALGFSFATTASGACRSDLVTGLTWGEIDNSSFTQSAVATQVSTANAGAGMCGFTDWRAPGAEELASLIDASKVFPAAINSDAGVALATQMVGTFWSANPRSVGLNDQMVVGFSSQGAVGILAKTSTAKVRLVRGTALGDPCDALRFVVHNDFTVSDPKTGLMWKQCPEGLSGAVCATGAAIDTGVVSPVTQVNGVNASSATLGLGYTDWRIPTRNELASLVCRTPPVVAPLINATVFPANDVFSYVTSTLDPTSGLPWFVAFDADGSVGIGNIGSKRLRLVRAGQ